jgi:hypothetical protein
MPTVIELAVKLNREASEGLARSLRAMPAEKTTWKPLDVGRDAVDQAVECAGFNLLGAKCLTTREDPKIDLAAFEQMKAENNTPEKALALLDRATTSLVAAIEAFPPEHLDDTVTMPWGMKMTFAELLFLNYWNLVYHQGQIAYIQTLYGDREMH